VAEIVQDADRALTKAGAERDPILKSEIKTRLASLWGRVEAALGPEAFERNLGEVRVGNLPDHERHAWAQTNADKDSRYVNLTIELDSDTAHVNVVGWFDDQLKNMLAWLPTPAGQEFIQHNPTHELVVFVREGRAGKGGKVVWQGAPYRRVKSCPSVSSRRRKWSLRWDGLKRGSSPSLKSSRCT